MSKTKTFITISSKNKLKEVIYKNEDAINIKYFDPNNIKIDEKSYKKILIYYIRYMTIKDSKYVKINIVNPLYLIFNKVDGYFEKINGYRYLMLVPTKENKEKIKTL